jgi:hypothetical protein
MNIGITLDVIYIYNIIYLFIYLFIFVEAQIGYMGEAILGSMKPTPHGNLLVGCFGG